MDRREGEREREKERERERERRNVGREKRDVLLMRTQSILQALRDRHFSILSPFCGPAQRIINAIRRLVD
jgi:hypothetical protein